MPAPATASAISSITMASTATPAMTDFQVKLSDTTKTSFTTDQGRDGISISPIRTNVNFFQISMVVIALREYSYNTYPLQGVFIDTFDANAYIKMARISPDGTANYVK